MCQGLQELYLLTFQNKKRKKGTQSKLFLSVIDQESNLPATETPFTKEHPIQASIEAVLSSPVFPSDLKNTHFLMYNVYEVI